MTLDVKETPLNTREQIALTISAGLMAHYGVNKDDFDPENFRAIFEDGFAYADIFLEVAAKQKQ